VLQAWPAEEVMNNIAVSEEEIVRVRSPTSPVTIRAS
jgi:hypothetical protein